MTIDPRLAALLREWRRLQLQGDDVPLEELCRDMPELLPQLRELVTELDSSELSGSRTLWATQVDDHAEGLTPSAPPHPLSAEHLFLDPGVEPIPGYCLVERLGCGGCGEVWKVLGPGDFPMAIKFIRLGAGAAFVELRALELMKCIRHAHLLATFGAWQAQGFLMIAMELADGTLMDRYHRTVEAGLPGIPVPELLEYMEDAAKGLDFLNEPHPGLPDGEHGGIQHRDVKPQNLLLVGGSVKVGDFGLAKLLEAAVASNTGNLTPAYAAPECYLGQTAQQSDQYSLAITYCQLRSGRLPFRGSPADIMTGHLQHEPDLSMLPARERPAVARALAKRPEDRWLNCREFVQSLAQGVQGRNPLPRPTALAGATSAGRWALTLFVAACLAVLNPNGSTSPPPEAPRTPSPDDGGKAATLDKTVVVAPAPKEPAPKEASPKKPAPKEASPKKPAPKEAPPAEPVKAPPVVVVPPIPKPDPEKVKQTAAQAAREKGNAHRNRGEYGQALEEYTRSLELSPKSVQTLFARGETYLKLNKLPEAVADFTSAVTIDPKFAAGWRRRGDAHFQAQDYRAAITDYTRVINLLPRACDVYTLRGDTYCRLSQYAEAIDDYTQALEIDPSDRVARRNRGYAQAMLRDFSSAIADCTRAIELDPESDLAYSVRGYVFYLQGDQDAAIADHSRAIELNPSLALHYKNRGDCHKEKKDYSAAIADYTKAIRRDGKDALAYQARSYVYNQQKKYDDAIADCTEAIRLNPKGAVAYNNRAFAYCQTRSYDQAIRDYTQAIELAPKEALYYRNRADAYERKGDKARAKADREKADKLPAPGTTGVGE
jgi:tetratricopeptide (TPR) repeat protein